MSGEIEAAGALATASAVAGVVEGEGGEGGAARQGTCANCDAPVNGRYCSNCGQATHGNRKLFHLVEEFLHTLFNLDTKLWRTLPMVVFRPGTLTRNYVYGKRARYISPLAMFLFAIFVMFFAVSFVEAPVEIGGTTEEQRAAYAENLAEAQAELAQAERDLAEERAAPPPTDGTPPGLDISLAEQAVRLARDEVEREQEALARIDRVIAQRQAVREAASNGVVIDTGVDTPTPTPAPSPETPASTVETSSGEVVVDTDAAPAGSEDDMEGAVFGPGETWQDGLRRLARNENFVVVQGMPELNERVRQKFENPDLAVYRIQEAASKFSFLLAPLSLPFIMLLFLWKRGTTMYDHIVYALYALSFAALVTALAIGTAQFKWTAWAPGWLILAGVPIHTFFHLGGAYKLGRWSAFWRTCFMLLFATIILSFFLVLIVILGLAG